MVLVVELMNLNRFFWVNFWMGLVINDYMILYWYFLLGLLMEINWMVVI